MVCFSPFFTYSPNGKVVGFPCGHCLSCRQKKANEWSLRISLESRCYKDLSFITLTYDNEHCPPDYSLVPSHLSSFLKRLRTYLSRAGFDDKIRFFGCGEYGERHKRPHYHLVIFGLPKEFFPIVHEAWKLGIVDIQVPRDPDSAASYVAGYVTKKLRVDDYRKKGTEPPFSRQSKGLGWTYIKELPCFTQVLNVNGYTRYIGRYLRNKLAEHFGILDIVKAQGLLVLEQFFDDFIVECGKLPEACHLTWSLYSEALRERWQKRYKGMMDLLEAKSRIFVRGDL